MITMEQGMEMIMAILEEGNGSEKIEKVSGAGGAHSTTTKSTKSTIPTVADPSLVRAGDEITYDGYGHVVARNGKAVAVGPKKKRKNARTSDVLRDDLVLATQALLHKVSAFEGKVGYSKTEGIIIRMADADYTIKIGGHAKREFENREADFVPTKSFITRGKAINHSSAIAKIIVAEFGNQNQSASFAGFENQNPFILLSATASTIRFENQNSEFSFKITKKRSRVVFE